MRAADVKNRLIAISEILNLIKCLDGEYVEAGPSGDITRDRINVAPTGRNFYSVDPLSIPTRSAYEVGKKLGVKLLERYKAEEGRIPETVTFVEWFTDPTNTDGEQIAEILFLLGVRPVWDVDRVVGLEAIPLEELKRPRIDVVVRIGGLFRDTCPSLIELIDEAISKVSSLDEPPELNFVRKHLLENGVKFRILGENQAHMEPG
ncbi:MAG: cobaltochelatase subunit CobN [Nitrososphaerales archaeon]